MRRQASLIKALALGSALACAQSCAGPASPRLPADLFQRPAEPAIPPEAATSEAAYEKWNADHADWGRAVAAAFDNACAWLREAGLGATCPEPRR